MKFDKSKIWGTCGQVLFAIFVIIALYAIGFQVAGTHKIGMTPDKNMGSPYWGLAISGIVIAFVGIVLPLVSMFVENNKMNFAFGWLVLIMDAVVFAVITAYFGKWAHLTGKNIYNKGFLAGALIFDIFGFMFAVAGNAISYKDNLLKLA